MKTILVTNDDGIYGPGLKPLVAALKKFAKVIVVIPDQERSGTSHSLTLHKPIRIQKVSQEIYLVNGTPADCTRYGAMRLIRGRVDAVVSGVNSGPNFGNDVNYSGTVAGAREGCMLGLPSLAVSVAEPLGGDFKAAARVAARIAKSMLANPLPPKIYLNVNVPRKPKSFKITTLGRRIYDEQIDCRVDPRGRKYYWLSGKPVSDTQGPGTDIAEAKKGYVSITPLKIDPTAKELFADLELWARDLE
jgi:5'-nucleotidase